MLSPEYFESKEQDMPITRIAHSETLYLADPDNEIIENQLLETSDGTIIRARLFLDAAYKIPNSNPHVSDPRYLEIPIQSMHDESNKAVSELRREIDCVVRVDYNASVSYGSFLEVIDVYDAESYVPPNPNETMSIAKKATLATLTAFTVSAVAAGLGYGFVRVKKSKK